MSEDSREAAVWTPTTTAVDTMKKQIAAKMKWDKGQHPDSPLSVVLRLLIFLCSSFSPIPPPKTCQYQFVSAFKKNINSKVL